jgi:hypothetical protein
MSEKLYRIKYRITIEAENLFYKPEVGVTYNYDGQFIAENSPDDTLENCTYISIPEIISIEEEVLED